jgi:hypothetical protein
MSDFQNISGFTVFHRYTKLLIKLKIITRSEYDLYCELIHEADWRVANKNTYGTFSGTREEVRKRVMDDVSQNTFNSLFKKLIELKLICRGDKARSWQVSNLHIHLAEMHWPQEWKEHKDSMSVFHKYLKNKLQNHKEEITDSVISEVSENLISFLTDEKYFKSLSSTNKKNEKNEIPMKGEEGGKRKI